MVPQDMCYIFKDEKDNRPSNVPISEYCFGTYNFDLPSYSLETTKKQLKQLYHDMTSIRSLTIHRRMEMAAEGLYKDHKIRGFCYLLTGQEAVPLLLPTGPTGCRWDGIFFGKGGFTGHMLCESFFGGNGITGASVPYNDRRNVMLNFSGDGAANQRQVHEAINLAKLWDLPVIFGCERHYIHGLRVTGMDVLAVMSAIKHGKEYIQTGNGPLVYEYATCRFAGQSMSDPGTAYRTREELRTKREHDPISNFRNKLIDCGVFTEDEANRTERSVRKRVDEEVADAEKSPAELKADVLFQDVYVPGSEPRQRRGRTIG
ncbi:thiamine diphosphate-binding protein [Aspergillus karnatakaensis]|uniref:putative pyruvate dehydrogenase E1 component alpha subunit n=1 Tax=Aspergillus karnatakaensis TaxID=1810916 RepID=UPI003CCD2CC9